MKNYKYIFLLVCLIPLLSGCFDDKGTEILLTDQFVSFYVPDQQIGENAGTGELVIDISQAPTSAVTLNLEVETTNMIEGVDFTVPSKSVTIPAGEFSVSVPFTVVDNQVFETVSRTFTVTISSAGSIPIEANPSVTVLVLNDDCPVNTSLWSDVAVEDVGFSNNPGTGAANANGDCNILIITADYVGAPATPVTWEFTPASDGALNGTVVAPRQAYACCAPAYEYEAEGVYDEETGIILADYTFYNADGSVFFTGQNRITAN